MSKQTFLIVKMSAIGDILHALNVAQYLKRCFPDCFVAWAVEKKFEELVKASPYVDEVIAIDMKSLKQNPFRLLYALHDLKKLLQNRIYDVVFDLQANCKSALMTLLSRAQNKVGFGKKSVSEWPNTFVTHIRFEVDTAEQIEKQYLSLVKRYFQDQKEAELSFHILNTAGYHLPEELFKEETSKQLMICPGSNWENKQLSENTLYSFLCKIEEIYDPMFVFIWGNKKEMELAIRLKAAFLRSKIAGSLPMAVWQALMLKMHCVISVDSCALHLAALAHVPTFSIYGPSSAKVYKPEGELHAFYQGRCPYGEDFTKRCHFLRNCATASCIKEISLLSLMKNFEALWKKI